MLIKISHQEAFENLSDKERRHKVYYKDVANGFYGKVIANKWHVDTFFNTDLYLEVDNVANKININPDNIMPAATETTEKRNFEVG